MNAQTKPSKARPAGSKTLGIKSRLSGGKNAGGKVEPEAEEEEVIGEEKPPTIITVLYGQNQRAIINTSCKSRALLEHIRRKTRSPRSVKLDLIDLEGQMKNLYKSESRDYSRTSDVLSRGEYILIKVEELSQIGPTRYTSLLHNTSQKYPEIDDRLSELMAESESRSDALRQEQLEKLKETAEMGWRSIRTSVQNNEKSRGVINALNERRKSRSSLGRGSLDRRKSVDFKKTPEGKKKKSRSG